MKYLKILYKIGEGIRELWEAIEIWINKKWDNIRPWLFLIILVFISGGKVYGGVGR